MNRPCWQTSTLTASTALVILIALNSAMAFFLSVAPRKVSTLSFSSITIQFVIAAGRGLEPLEVPITSLLPLLATQEVVIFLLDVVSKVVLCITLTGKALTVSSLENVVQACCDTATVTVRV